MKNKFLAVGIILCMLFSLAVAPVGAEIVDSGTCGDNLTWTLDDSGRLTISGTGKMDNWTLLFDTPWDSLRSSIKTVVIKGGVNNIGCYAFRSCSSITSVTIGNGVTSIGDGAFESCSNLTSIEIPDSVRSIDDGAFDGCSSLTSITIPDRVTSIERKAFCNCSKLTSITIPDRVTSIGDYAFCNCRNLTSVNIPNRVTTIGMLAFYNCSSLTSVTISNGVQVTSIGDYAFEGCSNLTSVDIPNSVGKIGIDAFAGCNNLREINVSEDNISYSSIDGVLFDKDKTEIIRWPQNKSGVVHVPDSVTTIGNSAFSGCSNLTSIEIPNSVKSIRYYAFEGCSNLISVTIGNGSKRIMGNVFYRCNNLTEINVSEDNLSYSSIDGVLFNKDKTEIIRWPQNKSGVAHVPDSVTTIENSAFEDCSNLTAIEIPDSVTTIKNSAFKGCSSLTSITIPDGVTSIGDGAFYKCISLTDVYYSGTEVDWNNISIGIYNDYLKNVTIHYNSPSIKVTPNGNTFTITPKNIETGNSIILAAYKNGKISDIKVREYKGTAEEFTVTSDYDSIKVMLWSSLKEMEPLVPAKSIE